MRSKFSPKNCSMRLPSVLCLSMAVACLLAIAQASRAWGQHGMPPGVMTKQNHDVDSIVRGQGAVQKPTFSAWRKLCFERTDAKPVCRITINGTLDTGQEMIRVDLIESETGGGARLQILLPPGEFLRAGLKVRIDASDPMEIPYTWCLSNICVAAGAVTPEFIQGMESGQSLNLEAVNTSLLSVTATVPLDQFAKINQGPPSQMFDQGLEAK